MDLPKVQRPHKGLCFFCLCKLLYMFLAVSLSFFLFALLMQGFEVIEIVVDVENCLQVKYL